MTTAGDSTENGWTSSFGGAITEADAAAIDALVEAGFDVSAVDPAVRKQADRAVQLLGLLDTDPGDDAATLIDVTFARALRARRLAIAAPPSLGQKDAAALDALVMSGFNPARTPASLRERARAHASMAGLVTGGPAVDGAESRIERVMAAVRSDIEHERERMRLDAAPFRAPPGGIRLADLVSMAAVVLIAGAILWPVLTAVREQSRRALCEGNLGQTSLALSTYANDHRDALPVVHANMSGGRWWDVGAGRSNSANLFELVRGHYVPVSSLACPGNEKAPIELADPSARDWRSLEEVSYSYQNMFGRERPAWGGPVRVAVLADRSPVVLRAVYGQVIYPFANTPNHAGAGQHVLFNDGATAWLRSPVLENGDNIWLPREIELKIEEISRQLGLRPLSGTEVPTSAEDVFLGP